MKATFSKRAEVPSCPDVTLILAPESDDPVTLLTVSQAIILI